MTGLRRWSAAFAAGLVLVAGTATTAAAATGHSGTVIRRTEYGIPHVRADDWRGLGRGEGYAFAEDNLCLLAEQIVTLDGERSRWFGAVDDNVASDIYHTWVNQTRVVERALAAPTGPSPTARDLVEGYAAGYNEYLATNRLSDASCKDAAWVRPITGLDIWRRMLQVAEAAGADGFSSLIGAAQPPGSTALARAGALPQVAADPDLGSNGVGLGSEGTASGTAVLLGNPHYPWAGDRRFHQVQLTLPGRLDVTGATLPGVPVVAIGHNDRLAWTHTVSTAVTVTVQRLALLPGDPTRYVVDGTARSLLQDPVTITVRRDDGSLAQRTQTVYSTPDGPLVAAEGLLPWDSTQAFSLRSANAGNLRTIDQWLAMGQARTVRELRESQARLLALPWVNTIAADSSGEAFYGDLQAVPHVTDELVARCGLAEADGIPVLDGSRSECAWGTDPGTVVPGLLGAGRLPSLIRRDFVSNMNDSPWLANPAEPLTSYPAIVGDVGTTRSARTRLGLEMIGDGLGRFTLPAVQDLIMNDRNYTAEQGRAGLVSFCREHPALTASDGTTVDVRAACAVLASWNGRGDSSTPGAVLWRAFTERGPFPWSVGYDPADPVHTPRGFNASAPAVATMLADAVQALGREGIGVDALLSEVQTYAGTGVAHGCTGNREGCFNVITATVTGAPVGVVQHGSSFIMAAELTRSGPRTRTLLTYGQSADAASPHHTDQLRLYNEERWVTDRFTEHDILADPALTVTHLR